MSRKQTIRVNPTCNGVTDDQGFPFKKSKKGIEVVKTLRIMRKLNSGELVEVKPGRRIENQEDGDGQ